MKTSNVLLLFILTALFVSSCQKELEYGSFTGAGTLKSDTAFNCLPSSVHGTFTQDAILTDTNYIEVQVDATLSGAYLIQSDTVNGYSFKGTGDFATTGLNTVRLYATGTPILPGTNSFIIRYDSSSFCIIDVDVLASAGAAEFTFEGGGGSCTGATLAGTYTQGVTATSANTATIAVTVTAVGNYTISTIPVNGVSFSSTGVFTSTTSPQNVTLVASGTPTAAGSFNFPVSGGASASCAFSVTFDPPAPPATFTLSGAPGNCSGATLNGTYQATIATLPSNTATIGVDVTVVGSYSISTTAVNGVTFLGTGVFTTTGPQTVTLTASGTAIATGAFNFPATAGSSTCTFSVTFDPEPVGIYNCKIDGVFTNFGNFAYASYFQPNSDLFFTGNNIGGIMMVLDVDLSSISGTVAVGVYVNNIAAGMNVSGAYTDASAGHWNPSISIPDPFTIEITSLTATHVTGTFSGTIRDNFGTGTNTKVVTDGVFDLPIQ